MKAHLENIDFDLWDIMNEDFSEIKAKRSDWSAEEMKKMQLNANAINIFYYSLAEDEFNRISNCTTANEIWKPLQMIRRYKRIWLLLMEKAQTLKIKHVRTLEDELEVRGTNQSSFRNDLGRSPLFGA
ncbi:hypothetical protein LINGRAHAP2_LOCUS14456 [Linum grandiflorum]